MCDNDNMISDIHCYVGVLERLKGTQILVDDVIYQLQHYIDIERPRESSDGNGTFVYEVSFYDPMSPEYLPRIDREYPTTQQPDGDSHLEFKRFLVREVLEYIEKYKYIPHVYARYAYRPEKQLGYSLAEVVRWEKSDVELICELVKGDN